LSANVAAVSGTDLLWGSEGDMDSLIFEGEPQKRACWLLAFLGLDDTADALLQGFCIVR
jgi:hypothetical protein